jgi:dTDP-4-amino-4,6-dideoxygalactose transaminase
MHQPIKEQVLKELSSIIDDSSFILGPSVKNFEEQFATFTNTHYCVGVASGCDAILWALKCIGVQQGDEVITVANTYAGTVLPITFAGATPVLVDCIEDTLNIDSTLIEAAITPKTKAIIAVHLFGQAADMDEINAIAKKYNLFVIEDAAQAHGAMYKGNTCGTLGDIAAFSFYPGKNLGAMGDGGALVTNNKDYADKARCLRNYGQSKKYHHDYAGWNSRLDSFQAAVLNAKLPRLIDWNQSRRNTAFAYKERLLDLPITIPIEREHNESVYHLFPIRSNQRDKLQMHLENNGIQTGIHYPIPIHKLKAFDSETFSEKSFPITEKVANELLSLPIFPNMTIEQIDYVCEQVHAFYK